MTVKRVAAGVGAVLIAALVSAPAHAQTYRYWSYWNGGDQWSYSARGPGFLVPADRAVEGWRFVVSPQDGSQAVPPAAPSSYAQLCPGQPEPQPGSKRVALVLDAGPAGIAPVGDTPPALSVACLTVPEAATGLQVLQQVKPLRFNSSGLICGIGGFPRTECPGQSSATLPAPEPEPSSSPAAPRPIATATAAAPTATADPVEAPRASASPSRKPPTTPAPIASSPGPRPSAIALSTQTEPPPSGGRSTPAWISAIGAAMIAALLAMAFLMRPGRSR